MSNDQIKTKLDSVQSKVKESINSLRKVLNRTKELEVIIDEIQSKEPSSTYLTSLKAVHEGFLDDIDKHVESLSVLIEEYQELIQDTV